MLPGLSPLLSFFSAFCGVLIPYRNVLFFLYMVFVAFTFDKLVFNP